MTPPRCISVFLPLNKSPSSQSLCASDRTEVLRSHTQSLEEHFGLSSPVCVSNSTISAQGLHNPGSCFPEVGVDPGQTFPCPRAPCTVGQLLSTFGPCSTSLIESRSCPAPLPVGCHLPMGSLEFPGAHRVLCPSTRPLGLPMAEPPQQSDNDSDARAPRGTGNSTATALVTTKGKTAQWTHQKR